MVDSTIDGGANTDRISVADGLTIANTVSFANATSIEELYVTGTAASSIALDVTAQTAGINTINIATATANSTVDVSEFTTGVNITGGTANDNLTGGSAADTISGGTGADSITGNNGADMLFGEDNDDIFLYTDNLQLRNNATVIGGNGTDTIKFSVAIDPLNFGNFNGDVSKVRQVEKVALFGASSLNLGDAVHAAGITTIITGSDNTELRYDDPVLGTITADATELADNKTLTLTQDYDFGAGPYFNVTNLKGNVSAQNLSGAISVTASSGVGFDIDVVGGNGNNTITGGAGNDTIVGGSGSDTITGAAGNDSLTGGSQQDLFTYLSGAEDNNAAFSAANGEDTIVNFHAGAGGDFIRWLSSLRAINGNTNSTATYQTGAINEAINPSAGVYDLKGQTTDGSADGLVANLGTAATNADLDAGDRLVFINYLAAFEAQIWSFTDTNGQNVDASELQLAATLTGVAANSMSDTNWTAV